jgi:serine/threonine protein kinase
MLNHDNILHIEGLRNLGLGGIVMEYAEYGTLRNVLTGNTSLDINEWRVKLCLDVANGMEYLHQYEPSIVHRDLRTSNILVCRSIKDGSPIAKVDIFPFLVIQLSDIYFTDRRLWIMYSAWKRRR